MRDVLLIESPVKNPAVCRQPWSNPPLVLAYVASILLREGYQVSAVDLNVGGGMSPGRVKRLMTTDKPKILAISSNTQPYPNALRVARIAKETDPAVKVVIMGPHVTARYEEAIREPDIDLVIRGTPEFTMLELTDALLKGKGELGAVRGIVYEKDGEMVVTPERPPLENVENMPYPALEIFPLEFYPYPGIVRTAWGGCPANCAFCNVPVYRGRGYVPREPEDIVQEMERVLRTLPFVQVIKLFDDTFFLEKDHLMRFTELLKKMDVGRDWWWTCTTRVNLVDREILQAVYDAHCITILVGAESGSQKILDSIGKGITPDQVRDAVRLAKEIGLSINLTFMYPFPEDTRETIRQTKEYMKELRGMGGGLIVAFTTPLPGTPLFDRADELGITILPDNWEDYDAEHLIITTKNLSREELEELWQEWVNDIPLKSFA